MESLKDKKLVNYIEKCINSGVSHRSSWRIEAREDYNFEAGRQWSDEDEQVIRDANKVPTVLNYVSRAVRAIVGMAIEAPVDVTFFSRKPPSEGEEASEEAQYSDITTQVIATYRDNCNANDEEIDSYRDTVICGEGWTETRIDYDTDPEGVVLVERVDPLEMIVDPSSKRPNYDDSKFRARIVTLSQKEFKDMFPKMDEDSFYGADAFFFEPTNFKVNDPSRSYTQELSNAGLDTQCNIQVAQFQWFEREDMYRVTFRGGNVENLTISEFDEIETNIVNSGSSLVNEGIDYIKIPQRFYKQVFYAGGKILNPENGPDYRCPINGFTFNAITGFRDRNKGLFYGIVRMLKDPQRTINKSYQQLIHILNTNAKGGIFAEQDAFANTMQAQDSYSKADSITFLNPGGLNKIREKMPPPVPAPLMQLLQMALEAMTDIPGINLEVLGLANRNQPNVLEDNRKESSATILADFHKALRRYRLTQAKKMLSFVRDYISDGRLVRIIGPVGVKFIPLIRDQIAAQYDLVISESPDTPNIRMKTFKALTQILPMAMQSGIPVPPDVIDYAPIPEALRRKWIDYILKSKQPPPQPEPDPFVEQMKHLETINKQLDARKKAVEVMETETKARLNEAKAYHEQAIGNQEVINAQEKMQEPSKESVDFINKQIRDQAEFEIEQDRKQKEAAIDSMLKIQKELPKDADTTVIVGGDGLPDNSEQ